MSLHFDLTIALDLKPDTPERVIDTLAYMTRVEDYTFDNPPQHEFFEDNYWRKMLRAAPEDTYVPGRLYHSFHKAYRFHQGGESHYRYTLGFRCYLLDDVFYEACWRLLEWPSPHSETEGYVGYFREELALHPTLIYFKHGSVYIVDAKAVPEPIRGEPPW
jgi:hypothetical protein